jgi:hypothetical protein
MLKVSAIWKQIQECDLVVFLNRERAKEKSVASQAGIDFYKTLFRPKSFRINFHPQIFDKFPPKNNG